MDQSELAVAPSSNISARPGSGARLRDQRYSEHFHPNLQKVNLRGTALVIHSINLIPTNLKRYIRRVDLMKVNITAPFNLALSTAKIEIATLNITISKTLLFSYEYRGYRFR